MKTKIRPHEAVVLGISFGLMLLFIFFIPAGGKSGNSNSVDQSAKPARNFELKGAISTTANRNIEVAINCKKEMMLGMEIADLSGRLIYVGKLNCVKGTNTVDYMGASLRDDVNYKVSLYDRDHKTSLRVIQKN
jgi:hypothetical protein